MLLEEYTLLKSRFSKINKHFLNSLFIYQIRDLKEDGLLSFDEWFNLFNIKCKKG